MSAKVIGDVQSNHPAVPQIKIRKNFKKVKKISQPMKSDVLGIFWD